MARFGDDGLDDLFPRSDPPFPAGGYDFFSQSESSSFDREPRTGLQALDLNSQVQESGGAEDYPNMGLYSGILGGDASEGTFVQGGAQESGGRGTRTLGFRSRRKGTSGGGRGDGAAKKASAGKGSRGGARGGRARAGSMSAGGSGVRASGRGGEAGSMAGQAASVPGFGIGLGGSMSGGAVGLGGSMGGGAVGLGGSMEAGGLGGSMVVGRGRRSGSVQRPSRSAWDELGPVAEETINLDDGGDQDEGFVPDPKDAQSSSDSLLSLSSSSSSVDLNEELEADRRKRARNEMMMASFFGKFYLVDSGYPNRPGYLAPYKGTKYHIPEFQNGPMPRGIKETFNYAHSSLRNVIERSFGVLKMKWKILDHLPSYPMRKQSKIITACMAIHNFIRESHLEDTHFTMYERQEAMVRDTNGQGSRRRNVRPGDEDINMNAFHDTIAKGLIG